MSKVRITENELKQIIRESVENVINSMNEGEDSFGWNPGYAANPQTNHVLATNDQMADRARENHEFNQGANTSLQRWNSLGTVGQLKVIQQLVGIPAAQCDGKLGPQTLGAILMKVTNGQEVNTPKGTIYPKYLTGTKWNYGKPGTYQNR